MVITSMQITDYERTGGGWKCVHYELNKGNSAEYWKWIGRNTVKVYLCYQVSYWVPDGKYLSAFKMVKAGSCPTNFVPLGINFNLNTASDTFLIGWAQTADSLQFCADWNVGEKTKAITGFGYRYYRDNWWWSDDDHEQNPSIGGVGLAECRDHQTNDGSYWEVREIFLTYKHISIGNSPWNHQISPINSHLNF